jgi:hypothetical protein
MALNWSDNVRVRHILPVFDFWLWRGTIQDFSRGCQTPEILAEEIKHFRNEMARAIVLTSEQWFLRSGTENTDGGLIV